MSSPASIPRNADNLAQELTLDFMVSSGCDTAEIERSLNANLGPCPHEGLRVVAWVYILSKATEKHPDENVVLQLCNRAPSVLLQTAQDYNVALHGCRQSKKMTYIAYAALHGRTKVVQTLVEDHGVKPDSVGDGCARPIALAASNGQTETVKYLYKAMRARGWDDKDILTRSSNCRPLLKEAVNSDSPETLAVLVERAFHLDPTGWFRLDKKRSNQVAEATLAHFAALQGSPQCLQWLLEEWPRTFHVNMMAKYGTLLHYACSNDNTALVAKTVECLMELGASVHLHDTFGRLPSRVAQLRNHHDVADHLGKLEKEPNPPGGEHLGTQKKPYTMETILTEEWKKDEKQAADAAEALCREFERLEMEAREARASKTEKQRQKKATKRAKKRPKVVTANDENTHPADHQPQDKAHVHGGPVGKEEEAVQEARAAQDGESVEMSCSGQEEEPPDPKLLCCPLGLNLFQDPVSAPDGQIYERLEIERWIDRSGGAARSPINDNVVLTKAQLVPNFIVRQMVQQWKLGKITIASEVG